LEEGKLYAMGEEEANVGGEARGLGKLELLGIEPPAEEGWKPNVGEEEELTFELEKLVERIGGAGPR
jgi:hypothetical protein